MVYGIDLIVLVCLFVAYKGGNNTGLMTWPL